VVRPGEESSRVWVREGEISCRLETEGEMGCGLEGERGEMGCIVQVGASGSGQKDDVDVVVDVVDDVEVVEGESVGGGMWPLSKLVIWAFIRASSVGWYSWSEYKSELGET
jgi:hypothetical protein